MTPEEALFISIGQQQEGAEAGQLFGKPCFNIYGKAFICFFTNEMVFKLTGTIRTDALQLEGSGLFDPSGKNRPMNDWIQVAASHSDQWPALAVEALQYVKSNTRRMQ